MITAQDIREKVFDRVRINGYDMTAVDDFLEELANEIAAAQQDNSVLRAKMKVLVEKIEEYRANEDATNKVLLSAQKLATQIEDDARARAAATISAAEAQSQQIIGSITERKEAEEKKLADAQEATAKYFAAVRALCNGQLSNLSSIEGTYVPETVAASVETYTPAPVETYTPAEPEEQISAVDDTVRSIEDSVENAPADDPVSMEDDFFSGFIGAPADDSESSGTKSFNI